MKWKIPSRPKIYEALGCLADERLKIDDGEVRVFSSSGNKYYKVSYSAKDNAVMCNDNSSFYQGFLGYPAIAYLMSIGVLTYDKKSSSVLRGIKWKDINQHFKNDFERAVEYVKNGLLLKGVDVKALEADVDNILKQIITLDLNVLGTKIKPPVGY